MKETTVKMSTPLVPISFGFLPQQLETTPDAGTERGVLLERARQDWRDMKVVLFSWFRVCMEGYEDNFVVFFRI